MCKTLQTIQQQNYELDRIEKIRSLLSGTGKLAQYFSRELDWLSQREKQWRSSVFRIGLIGITSSGKSTLVNALLGEKLLPEAVRPSSNNLVVCEWGETAEAVVQFNSSSKKSLVIPSQSISDELNNYGDEASNPDNIEGVEEIRIRSPRFKLGQGIVLIDTPGLDAHGHDDHEELTLEVMLPSVDAVLFLTTCKANSDEKIKEYVGMACDHGKPILVVQNMIDSVVERLGAHGQIIESRNQVLDKHLRRLRSTLQKAGRDAASIIQCSAKWALEGNPEQQSACGLYPLVTEIHAQRDALAPRVAAGRKAQITRWLNNIVREEQWSDDPHLRTQRLASELKSLQHQARVLTAQYVKLKQQLQSVQTAVQSKVSEFGAAADALNARSVDDAYSLKNAVEHWLRASPASLSVLNKQLMSQVSHDCESLNLCIDDIDLSSRLWSSASSLNIQTKERKKETRSEQSGIWGWIKRKADILDKDWGYDESVIRWTEIADIDSFKAAVHSTVAQEQAQVARFVTIAIQRVQAIRSQFINEIDQQAIGVKHKQAAAADALERKVIVQQLARLAVDDHAVITDQPDQAASISAAQIHEAWSELEVAPATICLVRLASLIARHRFIEMRDRILDAPDPMKQNQRVMIAGFDSDGLGDFVNRFWFDLLEINPDKPADFGVLQLDHDRVGEIGLACFSGTSANSSSQMVQGFLQSPCVLFLMLDIQQIGATESLLHRCALLPIHQQHRLVLVVQSIRELEHSDSIVEALRELQALAQRCNLKLSGVLVNDENIAYSKLAHWLLTSDGRTHSIAEEMQLLKALPDYARERANEIVRAWKTQEHAPA